MVRWRRGGEHVYMFVGWGDGGGDSSGGGGQREESSDGRVERWNWHYIFNAGRIDFDCSERAVSLSLRLCLSQAQGSLPTCRRREVEPVVERYG